MVGGSTVMVPVADRINEQVLRAALHQTLASLKSMRRTVIEQGHQGLRDTRDLYGHEAFLDQLKSKMGALDELIFRAKPISFDDVPEWARADVSANIDTMVHRLVKSVAAGEV